MLVKNYAEGTNGTTVTAANSNGGGGTAFTDVSIVSGGTLVFDTSQFMHGASSMRHQTGATSGTNTFLWDSTVIGAVPRVYVRFYLRLTTNGSARSLARCRSGTTQVMRLQMAAGGALEMRESGNSAIATSTSTLAVNTWYRIEYDARPGSSQTNTVRVYVGDSTTLYFELTGTGNFSSATTINEVTFGNPGAAANLTAAYYDSMAASDTGWIGPESTIVTPTADWTQTPTTSASTPTCQKTLTGVTAGTVLVAVAIQQSSGAGTSHNISIYNEGDTAPLEWITPANGEWGKHINAGAQLDAIKIAYARVTTAGTYIVKTTDTGADATANPALRVIPVQNAGYDNYFVCSRGSSTSTISQSITPALAGSLIIVATADDGQQGTPTYGAGWTRQASNSVTGCDFSVGNLTSPPTDTSSKTFTTTAPTTGTKYNVLLMSIPPVGGNLALSRAVGEAFAAGDTVGRALTAPRSLTESMALPETPVRAVARDRAGADALAAGDTVARTVARPAALAEPVALADSPAKATSATRSVGETFTLPDANVRTIGRARPIAETVVFADTVQRGSSRPVAGADALSAADSTARAAASGRATNDALNPVDSAARTSAVGKAGLDALAAVDSTSTGRATSREASEPVTFIDMVTRAGGAGRGGGEVLSPVGTVSRVAAYTRGVSRPLSLVDSASRSAVAAVALADLAVLAGAAGAVLATSRAGADQLGTSTGAVSGQAFTAMVAEAVALAGQTSRRADLARNLDDTVTLVDDAGVGGVVAVRLVGGLVQMTEVATAGRSAAVSAAGALTASSGVLTAVIVHAAVVSGALTLTDAASKGRALERGSSDFLVLGDTLERVVVLARARTDAVSLADAARKAREVARGVADQVALADAAVGYVGDPATIIIASPHAVTVTSRPAVVSDTTRRPSVRRTV